MRELTKKKISLTSLLANCTYAKKVEVTGRQQYRVSRSREQGNLVKRNKTRFKRNMDCQLRKSSDFLLLQVLLLRKLTPFKSDLYFHG